MKRFFYFLSFFCLLTFFSSKIVLANLEDGKCSGQEECDSLISQLSSKVTELSKTKDTLSNQIKLLDSQAQLTAIKIVQTENSIRILEKDIAGLTVKIKDLDVQLNQLSAVFIYQINQNYKLQKKVPFSSIFNLQNFNSFLEQYKYISVVQKNSQNTLLNMETVRTTYNIQKDEKEKKQKELEALQKQLDQQKISLANQKESKSKLLEVTKNDENKYQQLLNQALAQLGAFRNFSSSAGGGSCLSSVPGNGNDGNFFSQRDPRWCKQVIGLSCNNSRTCAFLGGDGCYVSSISMVLKKFGQDINPSIYGSNSSNFFGTTALIINPPNLPSGFTFRQTSYSSNLVDSEIRSGRYVIAELSAFSGTHFVVIISGSNGSYKIHDPWFGPDQNLNDHYSTSAIRSLRLISR